MASNNNHSAAYFRIRMALYTATALLAPFCISHSLTNEAGVRFGIMGGIEVGANFSAGCFRIGVTIFDELPNKSELYFKFTDRAFKYKYDKSFIAGEYYWTAETAGDFNSYALAIPILVWFAILYGLVSLLELMLWRHRHSLCC